MKKIQYLTAIALMTMISCQKEFMTPQPQNDPEAVFESLWKSFNTDYVLFEERHIDWNEQYDRYRHQVTSITTDDELYSIFKQMLKSLNDGHVQMIKPHEKIYYSNIYYEERLKDELFNLDLIKEKYLQNNYKVNGYDFNTYGWLENNIGYVHMSGTTTNWEDIDGLLDYFTKSSGVIIDLRHNSGGDFTEAFSRFGRFTRDEKLVFRSKSKNGDGPDDFTDWYDWKIQPGGKYFDKRIVVLTDRYTMSATERLVMAFQTLPNATTVGDTTNGSLSSKILRELPNGWNYSLCPQKVEAFDGKYYEGIGLIPDHLILNTNQEMENGVDAALEFAMAQF